MSVSDLIGHTCDKCRAKWTKTTDFNRLNIDRRLYCHHEGNTPRLGIADVWRVRCNFCQWVQDFAYSLDPS